MEITWTVELYADFDEDELNHIVNWVRNHNWNEEKINNMIYDAIGGWDDGVYYNTTEDVYNQIKDEIRRRLAED